MTRVWAESRRKGSALLLLLAIADFAHDDGTGAWPSQETLATKTRMSVRQVRRLLDLLVMSGELELTERPGMTSLLCVVLGREDVRGGSDKLTAPRGEDVRGGRTAEAPDDPQRPLTPDTAVSYEPSRTVVEPSQKSSATDDELRDALEELRGLEGYPFDELDDRGMLVAVRHRRPDVPLVDEIAVWAERGRKADIRDQRAALEGWLLVAKDAPARKRDPRCVVPHCRGVGRGETQMCVVHLGLGARSVGAVAEPVVETGP